MYLQEVDSSASVEEVERIVSRLKEFGRFLGSDESFEEFMKNRKTQHSDSLTPTLEAAKYTTQNQVPHLNNVPRRRVLRRQKVSKAFLETRPRSARRMSSRTDLGRKDCRNLGRGGKHCRSCCYDAKMQKLTSLQAEHRVEKKIALVSAENDGSKSTQESETNQVNETEMIDGACQVLPDDIDSKAEVGGIVGPGVRQHPELSGSQQNFQGELLKEISPAEANIRPRQSEPLVQDSASTLTAKGVNVTQVLCPEENLEKQKDLIKTVSNLLVDKWCLEGQVKALEDNERELTEAKSEISLQLDAAHRQLSGSCSDTGRPHHNVLALDDQFGSLQRQLKEMEDRRDDDEAVKSQLKSELDNWKKKVVDLEAVKKRLEGEVEGWMETVMEVRRGRITLLNHMDNITHKVGKLNSNSFKGNKGDTSKLDRRGHHSSVEQTCGCRDRDQIRVNELQADIETLSEQRKIQDGQIEQLSDLLQKANDQKQELMNHLTEVQQERRNLQVDFDSFLACQ
ncbi:uncharacterized protein LOC105438945 [Strongylocentrotus purpuratus]|uniref:Uncharacterized protein n=1 Tax=Strongylocentrotus purpuratus TaxID=7668 RepID=A0A7M7T0X9_STRPU|nr:uncharacterized protein LOC105438945 [Strongylocentrotus purpuratus]